MNHASVLSILLLVWLVSCAQIRTKKIDEFRTLWWPILTYLDQVSPRAETLTLDLANKYKQEIKDIGARCPQNLHDKNHRREQHACFYHEIEKLNALEMKGLEDESRARKSFLDNAKEVLSAVEDHSMASSKRVFAYQEGGQIGFCFGRALLVHYLLLKAGVPNQDILKIFALGDFLLGGQVWRFHVAVMVREGQGYLVVDPLYGEVADSKDWMSNIASLEIKHPFSRARFFITDPRKFMPESGKYTVESLSQPELKSYFRDLAMEISPINLRPPQ